MISGLDLNIYRTLFQQKKLTEKYLGKLKFEWAYSEVHYKADCTVGVPFDLFDKTIVGILLVDNVLRIEEIGDILGMNVIHNPEKQQYRDDAEFDILRMAVDNLFQYKMIEIGDASYSSCRLTSIGREYAQKARKFKIENNKPFFLVYDHTSQNHIEAKLIFKNIKGKNQLSLIKDFDFLDETLMKKIASIQSNEVYDEGKGNSFTNPQIDQNRSQSFLLEIFVALQYDLESNKIRLIAYEPNTKTINEYFSKWLNDNKLEEIIGRFQIENPVGSSLPMLPQSYVQRVAQGQKNFEQEVTNNPVNALEIATQINQELDYIDVEYFWNNLKSFVSVNDKEFWFFLSAPNSKCLSLIEKLVDECPDIIVFVTLNITQNADLEKQIKKLCEKSCLHNNNLFAIQAEFREIQKFKFWRLKDSLHEYNETSFSIGKSFFFNSLTKTNIGATKSYNTIKYYIAKKILPQLKENLFQVTKAATPKLDNNINKAKIFTFQNIDKKALAFSDLKEQEDIRQQITSIIEIKNEITSLLKEKHKEQLQSQLKYLLIDFDKQEFTKLESLQEFQIKLETIHSELFEDYTGLLREVECFENTIKAEEQRIKDELLSKTYIIDTNVFIEDPEIIAKVENKHYVVLSHTVINELDKLKKIDKLKEKSSKAIAIINKKLGKSKQLRTAKANTTILGVDYRQNSSDNRILAVAFMYKDKNPLLLTNDNRLQLKAKSIGIPTISLKEFLSEKPVRKIKPSNSNEIDYKGIFNQMQPDKNGTYQVSKFISILKKQVTGFDYKTLGYEKAWQFIESLGFFEVTDNQFLKLKQ
jgi:rRNA-processing protein FCF1